MICRSKTILLSFLDAIKHCSVGYTASPIIIPTENDAPYLQLSARFKRSVDIGRPT